MKYLNKLIKKTDWKNSADSHHHLPLSLMVRRENSASAWKEREAVERGLTNMNGKWLHSKRGRTSQKRGSFVYFPTNFEGGLERDESWISVCVEGYWSQPLRSIFNKPLSTRKISLINIDPINIPFNESQLHRIGDDFLGN